MDQNNLEVTQKYTFECCYVAPESRADKLLNAHRYQFEATVVNPNGYSKNGRIISFEELKDHMKFCSFDGMFLYTISDVKAKRIAESFELYGVHTYAIDSAISAEVILEDLTRRLCDIVNSYGLGNIVKETKLRETSNSYVTWRRKES